MSLVHEALEKAKREASAKNAKELGLPDALAGAAQPFRANRGLHPAIVAGTAALVTLAIVAALAWHQRERRNRQPAPSVVAAPASSTAAVELSPPPPTSPAAPAREAKEEESPASAPAPPLTPPTSPPAPTPAVAPPRQPAPHASTKATPSAATPGSDSVASFRRQMTLDDGTVIQLGGIAWSEEAPLAYLNGKLYVRGERIAGLRVEKIERERVLLVGVAGERVYLTLH